MSITYDFDPRLPLFLVSYPTFWCEIPWKSAHILLHRLDFETEKCLSLLPTDENKYRVVASFNSCTICLILIEFIVGFCIGFSCYQHLKWMYYVAISPINDILYTSRISLQFETQLEISLICTYMKTCVS
jgi:hypothetical protein